MVTASVAFDFWAGVLPSPPRSDWLERIEAIVTAAESLRGRADYNTGSILPSEAYSLCALAAHLCARVVIEVGTFIGLSTRALAIPVSVTDVYTCDASNDCLDGNDWIHTYPKHTEPPPHHWRPRHWIHTYPRRTSTEMLGDLVRRKVVADLCFFDGTLATADLDLLDQVTYRETVYAFHDYNHGPKWKVNRGVRTLRTVPRKGIGNVELLTPRRPQHVLIEPQPDTTLALLVPEYLVR